MRAARTPLTLDPPASVPQRRRLDDDENPFRPVAAESSRRANGLNSPFRDGEDGTDGMDDVNTADDFAVDIEVAEHLEVEVTERLEETRLDEDDEDSQPLRSRRKSDRLKGPHPAASSGVPDSVDPTGNSDPVDDGDHSDVGEPLDDNEPEPMDYGDAEPEPNVEDDDDDADLERQAMADENAEGDDSEEGTSMETSSAKTKRGTKRPATATPIKKVQRKSQLAVEGDNQYRGDFVTRRSGRVHLKPLDWWRGERKEWQKGANGPEVKSVVRVPREEVKPRPAPRKKHGAKRGRSQSAAAPPESSAVAPGMVHLDFDYDVDTMANVRDYVTGETITRSRCKVRYPADAQKRSCHIL